MDKVVPALGECVDESGQARHPDHHSAVERDLDFGDRAEASVDVRVGPDHLHLKAGDAAVADLPDGVGDAVHRAEPVNDQRDAWAVAIRACQLRLLAG